MHVPTATDPPKEVMTFFFCFLNTKLGFIVNIYKNQRWIERGPQIYAQRTQNLKLDTKY